MKKNKLHMIHILGLLLLMLLIALPGRSVSAESTSPITTGAIDYEELTLQIYNNNNTIVYYSVDESNWIEVEGGYHSGTKSYTMDISWINAAADVTLYLKGNLNSSTKTVTLPMQDTSFKVTYDKAEEEFTFENAEEYDTFEWRKTTDYNWNSVSLDEASASYKEFLNTMESLKMKGAKIILRLPQITGTANNFGSRPSKEVTLTIPARAEAPKVSVNSSKLTINTTESMEYYNTAAGMWIDCSKSMSLEDIAPKTLYKNGAQTVTLMIRTAASSRASYSKTAYVTIKGQAKAPEIGGNDKDVTYYFSNSKLVMAFNQASSTNVYEYTIIKPGTEYDPAMAKWSSVTSTKLMTISNGLAPKGSTVYVRKKGTDANSSKGTELILSSATNSFTVNY